MEVLSRPSILVVSGQLVDAVLSCRWRERDHLTTLCLVLHEPTHHRDIPGGGLLG